VGSIIVIAEAAVFVLMRRFAMELGPHGITVNAVDSGSSLRK
jgi:NAD(P)-dependent dehydrogenase (short-subunit alcohol dehydrogenase family)